MKTYELQNNGSLNSTRLASAEWEPYRIKQISGIPNFNCDAVFIQVHRFKVHRFKEYFKHNRIA